MDEIIVVLLKQQYVYILNISITAIVFISTILLPIFGVYTIDVFTGIYISLILLFCLKSFILDNFIINYYKNALVKFNEEITNFNERIEKLNQENKEYNDENEEYKQSNEKYKKSNDEFKENNKKMSMKLKEFDELTEQMTETNNNNQIEIGKLILELNHTEEEYKLRIKDFEKSNDILDNLNQKYYSENIKLYKINEVMKSTNENLTREVEEMKSTNGMLLSEVDNMKITNENLSKQVNELKKLYIDAKNLYINLVLAGENIRAFEQEFADTAEELRNGTSDLTNINNDLKLTTNALSNMVNYIADKIPEDKQNLSKRSFRDIVKLVMTSGLNN